MPKNKKYIIYIHVDYIRLLVAQEGGDYSREAVTNMHARVYKEISDFLMSDNEGTLSGHIFVGHGGQICKSFEVFRLSDCKTIADVHYLNRRRKKYSRHKIR